MLALVGRRLTMYYGIIIAQIVFRHIPGLYYYTAVPSVNNDFSTIELTLILLQYCRLFRIRAFKNRFAALFDV